MKAKAEKKGLLKSFETNRRNAQRSTGPKSTHGKLMVRANSTKHGLLSKQVLLEREDEAAFDRLRNGFQRNLQPVGALESFLFETIVTLAWRIQRLPRIESEALLFCSKLPVADGRVNKPYVLRVVYDDPIGKKSNERGEPAQEEANKPSEIAEPDLGHAFIASCKKSDVFGVLTRYETSMVRNFTRCLHELQRLQATRTGAAVPPHRSQRANDSFQAGQLPVLLNR